MARADFLSLFRAMPEAERFAAPIFLFLGKKGAPVSSVRRWLVLLVCLAVGGVGKINSPTAQP